MSYIDGFFDRDADIIRVVERVNGQREYREFPAKYTFYVKDPKGKFKSVYGDQVSRVVCKSTKDHRKEVSINRGAGLFESDINPMFQCLSEHYLNQDAPKLNIAFWDIETDFDAYAYPRSHIVKIRRGVGTETVTVDQLARLKITEAPQVWDEKQKKWGSIVGCCYLQPGAGFSSPEDAVMPITAITVCLQWLGALITVAMPPKGMPMHKAQEMCKARWGDAVLLFPNSIEGEQHMLLAFLELIADADVISGWNSEGYDIPYTVNRVKRILSSDDTRKFCLWGQKPKKREYEKFGKKSITYDLVGRVHLDSLSLYRKYTYEERHTYRLDAIGELEVGERKTAYEGTLDQLYNNDFEKFVEYNRQDVALLDKLDEKLQFIDLANQLAHANTVLLQTTMGVVAVTEQAIVNEAHRRGLIVPNRTDHESSQAAGAYVAYPKKGLHKWIGAMDLKSLYPNVIRALNMGPETIVGQLRPDITDQRVHEDTVLKKKSFASSWEGRFSCEEYEAVMQKRKDIALTIDWETGASDVLSGAEVYKLIFDSHMPWMMSANGTIFTTEIEGVIPGLLERWYSERKDMQAVVKHWKELSNGIELDHSLADRVVQLLSHQPSGSATMNITDLISLLQQGDDKAIALYIDANNLVVKDGRIFHQDKKYVNSQIDYWDKRQLVKKIQLNSLYGAILNVGCRFFDKRMGQSTTLTGRQVVKHMSAEVNKVITGEYNHVGKAIIYGDTDSEIGSTLHVTNFGEKSVEDLFESCQSFWSHGDKEYACHPELMVMSYDPIKDQPYLGHINYIYRHRVSKTLYEIQDAEGNTVTVTQDHSVMIERDGTLTEVKPQDITETDVLISLPAASAAHLSELSEQCSHDAKIALSRATIKSVEKTREADNEYVYDIGMKNEQHPWFFGNNILVHNSVYFSAYPELEEEIIQGKIPWSKESVVQLYDQVSEQVNSTFQAFMAQAFHCPASRAGVIAAGREIVGSSGLYITKKRYAVLVYDDEGTRKDVNGSAGKVKAMGLDLRRSDTPVFMQDFLKEVLSLVLEDAAHEDVIERIIAFRKEFNSMLGWLKGTPKRVNSLAYYRQLEEKKGKAKMPGHVRASLNWNTLKRMNSDYHSMEIVDGMKVIVCKLKQNPLGFTSVAYPTDEMRLPEWLKQLPFDEIAMAETIVDNKLDNLIGVLDFDMEDTKQHTTFSSLFNFGD